MTETKFTVLRRRRIRRRDVRDDRSSRLGHPVRVLRRT